MPLLDDSPVPHKTLGAALLRHILTQVLSRLPSHKGLIGLHIVRVVRVGRVGIVVQLHTYIHPTVQPATGTKQRRQCSADLLFLMSERGSISVQIIKQQMAKIYTEIESAESNLIKINTTYAIISNCLLYLRVSSVFWLFFAL